MTGEEKADPSCSTKHFFVWHSWQTGRLGCASTRLADNLHILLRLVMAEFGRGRGPTFRPVLIAIQKRWLLVPMRTRKSSKMRKFCTGTPSLSVESVKKGLWSNFPSPATVPQRHIVIAAIHKIVDILSAPFILRPEISRPSMLCQRHRERLYRGRKEPAASKFYQCRHDVSAGA